jgi:solute:Na+ symporter, SSS family
MSVTAATLLGIVAYLLLILYIGYRAYRRNIRDDMDDRYLVGRNLNTFVLVGTLFATWFSTFAFLGGPGTFYLDGVNWLLFGFFNSMGPVLILVFGIRMWAVGRRYGFVTPSDLLASYYDGSRRIRLLVALVSIVVLFPYSAIQLSGIAKAVAGLTGNVVTYTTAILFVAVAVALYSIFGGSRAVVWTDAIQGFIFAFLLIGTAMLVVSWADGWTAGWQSAASAQPEKLSFTGSTAGSYFTLLLLWTFGWVLTPHLWQRMYMAKSAQTLVKSAVVASGLALWVVTFSGAIIGFVSMGLFPEIPAGFDTDALVPLLYSQFLPLMGVVLVVATFAAGMSTLDSQVISGSSIFSLDIYREYKPDVAKSELGRVGHRFEAVFVTGLVVFTLLPAGQELLIPLASIGVGMALVFLMPLIGALFWPRATEPAAFWSTAAGWAVMLILQIGGYAERLPTTFGPPAWGFFVAVAIFYGVSYLTDPVSQRNQERFHGYLAEAFPTVEAAKGRLGTTISSLWMRS